MGEIQVALLDQFKDSMVQLAFVLGTAFLLGKLAKAQPSGYALALILLPVPLLILSLWWPLLATVSIIYTPLLMLFLLVDGFLLSVPARYVSLTRSLSRKFSIGQKNQVMLTVMNNSGQSISGTVRDSVPEGLMEGNTPESLTLSVEVMAYNHQALSYELFPTRRGLYRLERIHFRYRSRLGLLWLGVKGGRPDKVQVTPDLRRVRQMRLMASRSQTAGDLQKRALGLEGTQFSGLRHYFAGDDIRKMAWQATARLDLPVVRTYTHEVEQPIFVLLDAGRKMQVMVNHLQKYDWALNTALAFMGVAIDRGDAVGAGTFSNRILSSLPLGTGRHHLSRLLDTLAETEVQPVEPDYEAVMLQFARNLKRRSLVVIFTDLIDPIASRSLLASVKSFSRNHILMIVTLADSQTIQEAEKTPETPFEVYKKGVALDLLEIRRQTQLALCRNNNAIVVDAPPEKLDETLIARYLELKRQNRL